MMRDSDEVMMITIIVAILVWSIALFFYVYDKQTTNCESLWWSYVSMYKWTDFCIKDGLIIKTY